MKRLTQKGFSHILVLIALVGVFALVGFAGYQVMNSQTSTDTSVHPTAETVSAEQKTIDSTPELKSADTTLSEVNTQLNTELDTAALDADIQNLY